MTKRSANRLLPGLYKLWWKSGGISLASVGLTHDGARWYAPTNWTSGDNEKPMVASTNWRQVLSVSKYAIAA